MSMPISKPGRTKKILLEFISLFFFYGLNLLNLVPRILKFKIFVKKPPLKPEILVDYYTLPPYIYICYKIVRYLLFTINKLKSPIEN